MTADLADLHDPSSAAYKKAHRKYKKSTKHRPDSADTEWTAFRASEKRFKARFPQPDLSDVLDLAADDTERREEVDKGWWKGRSDAVEVTEIAVGGGRRGYAFPQIPGLVLLPNFVSESQQRDLVRWALHDHARSPNITNLDTHYAMPHDGLWKTSVESPDEVIQPLAQTSLSFPAETATEPTGPRSLISNTPASPDTLSELIAVPKPPPPPSTSVPPLPAASLLYKLRWANIGWFYHWTSKMYDFGKGRQDIHERVRALCKDAVGSIPWDAVYPDTSTEGWDNGEPDWDTWDETYEPDAGIVNFYQEKDTLMGHVDRSEVCATSPLVSISLGNAAVFLIGGQTRDVPPVPILLRSGDVVIMSGPRCRRAYHGVPRILEGTLPKHLDEDARCEDEDWAPYAKYLRTTRINVNVRQVFPKGFEPPIPPRGDVEQCSV
ncbi:hypothetical protein PENSPDRAFT_651390 [Peniophora sp. CONT]|nr:hypothetical protein PENSPDRAFT_651390 [Peniophora sp. CONT]